MFVDILTFIFSITTLAMVAIRHPEQVQHEAGSFAREVSFGFRYIWQDRGLCILLYILFINFAAYLTCFMVLAPIILARTGLNALALASVQTAMGIGGALGGLAISFWGGPKRQIHGVLLATGLSFMTGDFILRS